MRLATALKFLAPHGLAVLCFLLAFAWMLHIGSNRSLPDLYLAVAGYAASIAALVSSLLFLFKVWGQPVIRTRLVWLMAHVSALTLLIFLGMSWFGHHLV